MQVQIGNRQKEIRLSPRKIRKIAEAVLKKLGCPEVELSLAFVDNQEITRLNRQYLGDVVISVDQAALQAKQMKHSLEEELLILILHGLLHLLGYDHTGSAREAKKMKEMERRLDLAFQG